MTFLFGPHNYRMHMAVTGLTMLSIGLVFTLIIALDYPFRGELSVGDENYMWWSRKYLAVRSPRQLRRCAD